jgi:phosphoglycerate dehydrogenase-like enzyme
MKHKVLFLTERSPRHQQAALTSAPDNLDVVMLRRPSRAEILQHLADTEFLISERAGEIDAELIQAGKKLRLIQRLGSLAHDIDLAAAQQAGVAVCLWPILNCILVAEHMLMQMLALAKKLPEVQTIAKAAGDWGQPPQRTDENTFAYNWSGRTDIKGLYGAVVGILGFGEIGAELARRLRAFQPSQVIYHKRRQLPIKVEQALGLTYAGHDALVANGDFLCSLLPFYPETEMLLNAGTFARMKRGAFLVHCGSGGVIDEQALAEAVRSGQLGGAALDTYEWEPIRPHNPLLSLARDGASNVLLTPHTAAGAPGPEGAPRKYTRQSDYINIMRLLRGEPLLHQVEVGRWQVANGYAPPAPAMSHEP